MEYLKGESLDAHLKDKGELPIGETVRIGREIAEGLQGTRPFWPSTPGERNYDAHSLHGIRLRSTPTRPFGLRSRRNQASALPYLLELRVTELGPDGGRGSCCG
jgi:hypothetical protein